MEAGSSNSAPSTVGPPYAVITPDSAGFERACELELEVFRTAGFLDPDGTLETFRRFDRASEFLTIPGEGRPMGVARVIYNSELGFITLRDMHIGKRHVERISALEAGLLAELATLAPRYRSARMHIHLVSAGLDRALEQGLTHYVASLDEKLRKQLNSRLSVDFTACEPIGPTVDYLGSPTTPTLLDLTDGRLQVLRTNVEALVQKFPLRTR